MTFCGGYGHKCTSIGHWTYQATLMAAAPLAELSPTELDHARDDEGCLDNILYIYNIYIYLYIYINQSINSIRVHHATKALGHNMVQNSTMTE